VSSPASGTATVNPDGSITFTPAAVGSASFQYTVQDSHAATSNAATVSITVQAADTLNTVRAQFRTRGDWRVTGTATIPGPENTITLHIGPTLAGPVLGTVAVDATGGWDFVLKGSSIRPDSTNTLSVESTRGGRGLAIPANHKLRCFILSNSCCAAQTTKGPDLKADPALFV